MIMNREQAIDEAEKLITAVYKKINDFRMKNEGRRPSVVFIYADYEYIHRIRYGLIGELHHEIFQFYQNLTVFGHEIALVHDMPPSYPKVQIICGELASK
jgi:hypothetical protein